MLHIYIPFHHYVHLNVRVSYIFFHLLKYNHFCRSTITREKFEELCLDLWDKALVPLKEVLEYSGLKTDEIYAVELIGGATRVPKLQVSLLLLSSNK